MFASYRGVGRAFTAYWQLYGGTREIVRSPYLHAAVLITLLCWWQWLYQPWFELVIQVLPNIIGFSIGAFAIWLAFGDEKFRRLFAERNPDDRPSDYLIVTASFAHFVIVQIVALLLAIMAKALAFAPAHAPSLAQLFRATGFQEHQVAFVLGAIGGFIGFVAFVYAVTLGIATVFALMRLARAFEQYAHTVANGRVEPVSPTSEARPPPRANGTTGGL